MSEKKKITVSRLRKMKEEHTPIAMLTAYDAPTARLAQLCGMDLILVGDSLGMAVLGYPNTLSVTLEESLHHCAAVKRGAPDAFVIGDMPFMTYHVSPEQALVNAARYLQEAHCDAVKIEGDRFMAPTVARLTAAGVPVMGHIGLRPQQVLVQGGYKIAGRTESAAEALIADAKEAWHFETAGRHYWAAKRADGDAYSISNYMSVEYPERCHVGLVEHAREAGYLREGTLNFARDFAHFDVLSTSGMVRRCRTAQQLMRPRGRFEIGDMLTALRDHSCNDEWTEGASCVCMHAKDPTPPVNPRQSIDCETTNSMIAVLKPGDSLILSPGMSTTCMAPFQPFWFDAFSSRQVFDYRDQERAIACWIRREGINRAALDGRIPVDEYRAELHEMESRWIRQAPGIPAEERQAFVDENAAQADAFIDKWLGIAQKLPSRPMGGESFRAWWKIKNAALGADKRIAY